ncbi:hypothetical protein U4E84_02370 [Halorubrum sp. AD140]|uniref:hypothetical protein n=1 Tax=Halorubrum sp. AD140 TaxID=3050073 RepID=UPI002ACCEE92|nr:hypothetical protein [Halorubrum sp. AD140]MDZ5810200.1 hypothetical protein [Halorubrum sp. AD140]
MSRSTSQIDSRLTTAIEDDPRVLDDAIRRFDAGGPPVVLVGVVHDHPASVFRVASVVDAVEPETIAIEVPSLLVPAYASDRDGAGGEVTAAIAANPSIPVAGIDIPGRRTLRSVLAELRTSRAPPRTALRTLRSTAEIAARTVAARLSRLGVPGVPTVEQLELTQEYDISAAASPARQADHERAHLRRGMALVDSLTPPPETALLDAIRERQMADRLAALRRAGPVVCVVGFSHLDGVAARLKKGS